MTTGVEALHRAFEIAIDRVRRGEMPPLSEQEIVDALIALANLAENDAAQAVQIYWTFCFRPRGFAHVTTWEREQLRVSPGEAPILRVLMLAKPFVRKVLLELIVRPKTARLRYAATITKWISKLEIFGVPEFKGNSLRYQNIVCAPISARPDGGVDDVRDVIQPMAAWALAILLDRSRKIGEYLHQCRLGSGDSRCQNLFLAQPTKDGGRPIRYCSAEHIAEARRQQAAHRAQRYRDRVASRHK